MGTYNHKRVLTDWETGQLTPEMAIGHALQHLGELYTVLATVNTTQRKLQEQLTHLENSTQTIQAEFDRLVISLNRESPAKRKKGRAENSLLDVDSPTMPTVTK